MLRSQIFLPINPTNYKLIHALELLFPKFANLPNFVFNVSINNITSKRAKRVVIEDWDTQELKYCLFPVARHFLQFCFLRRNSQNVGRL